jgi:hypothetical protein
VLPPPQPPNANVTAQAVIKSTPIERTMWAIVISSEAFCQESTPVANRPPRRHACESRLCSARNAGATAIMPALTDVIVPIGNVITSESDVRDSVTPFPQE